VPTITITIDLPEGARVHVEDEDEDGDGATEAYVPSPEEVRRYWDHFLSDNGRSLYRAAAEIEQSRGSGFTLNDVANQMGIEYASAQSIHRTTGRASRRWTEQSGHEGPIRLDWNDYSWNETEQGMRTTYSLPDGVADQILAI
jgi:hypothetical protein